MVATKTRQQRMAVLLENIGLHEHPSKEAILIAMDKAFLDGFQTAENIIASEMAKALQSPAWLEGE